MFKNIVFFNSISEVLVREAELIKKSAFDENIERSIFVVTYEDKNSINDMLYVWMPNVNKYIPVGKMGDLWCYFEDHCSVTLVPNGGFDTDIVVHNGYLVSESDYPIDRETFVKCFNHKRFVDIYVNMLYEEYVEREGEKGTIIITNLIDLANYMMENYDFGIINIYCFDFEKQRYVKTRGVKMNE